ncbi:MAG: penicillin-binding transpeptidase domain-containing protein [Propionibacteriaceae bacterium]|nr:penicillin-binding transpeptidase domain-containing protein [Propionibacteriaceae bacterium]
MTTRARWGKKLQAGLACTLAAVLLTAGCVPGGSQRDPGTPPDGVPAADDVVAQVVAGLPKSDLTAAPLTTSPADATAELNVIFAGMDGIVPAVEVTGITYEDDGKTAAAQLKYTYPVTQGMWEYTATLPLENTDGNWAAVWSPTVVHPQLTAETRLRHTRKQPKRAPINDKDGLALVEERTLYQVGIDKSLVEEANWPASAAKLAEMLSIDAAAYTEKVLAGGPQQFVIAATMAQDQIPPTVTDIPGGAVHETAGMVAPSDTFALSLLGKVGNPTPEQIEKAEGAISASDMVGVSGLQARYDEQLRGAPQVRVDLVARSGATAETVSLYDQQESVGAPIQLSLDRALQEKAEALLAQQIPDDQTAAIVVLDINDGGVLAAANSKGAGEYPYATYGSFAPGSTFKVISSLAMIRADGLTADSTVECPISVEVGGHTVKNYARYPEVHTGSIPFKDALAYSCNTTFAAAAEQITPDALKAAAASLGVGTDYDAGFTSNFGKVEPNVNDPIDRAISMIGQGGIEMSPLGMAAVAASVGSGKTTIPWLVKDHQATSTATALTPEEATSLQAMMRSGVDYGTGKGLQGVMTGAKSGTAEFGADAANTADAHAWMIAWNDKYAVAVFLQQGSSGSTSAAPLITALLS